MKRSEATVDVMVRLDLSKVPEQLRPDQARAVMEGVGKVVEAAVAADRRLRVSRDGDGE